MRTIFQITRSELNALFYSPIAWLLLVIYTFQLSLGFTETLNSQLVNAVLGQNTESLTFKIFISSFYSPLYKTVLSSLFLYVPLLTMGSMSKEYSSGSIKLLLSSPITEKQIILGKYFSLLAYGFIMLLILGVFIFFGTFAIKDIDLPLLSTGLIAIYLVFCFYAAIGLFFSCLTSYQIVAALGTLTTIIFFQLVGNLFQTIDFVRDITYWLNVFSHGFINGLISSAHIFYFLLMSGMFVTFSILHVRFQRQTRTALNKALHYLAVFVITLAVGYATSRPQTTFYKDTTRFQQATLTPKSQEIIHRFKGTPVLNSYINFLGDHRLTEQGVPKNRNTDKLSFGQYVRFMPDLKMNYVYYYDSHSSMSSHHAEHMGDEGTMGLIKKAAKINSITLDEALTSHEVAEQIDSDEMESGFVRTFEVDSLPKAYIRMYRGELQPYPTETEISTALAAMLDGAEKIGFITGHGERKLKGKGDQDYYELPNSRDTRNSLVNKGFLPLELSLDEEIPADVNILVIADMQTSFSEKEFNYLKAYIERGGNLLINTDINRKKQMTPLLELFGIEARSGILAQENQGYTPATVFNYFTDSCSLIDTDLPGYAKRRIPVILPGTVCLTKKADAGYHVVPILEARTGTQNIAGATNPDELAIDSAATANPKETYYTALALTRNRENKEQRILIVGDADWFSRAELKAVRSFATGNALLANKTFKWMCYGKYPMTFERPSLPDNKLYFKFEYKKLSNFFFLFLFPLLWLASGSIVWYKRKRK